MLTIYTQGFLPPSHLYWWKDESIWQRTTFKDEEPETVQPEAAAAPEPVIFHEEKEISLDDDDDEPQYEEEKLQVQS